MDRTQWRNRYTVFEPPALLVVALAISAADDVVNSHGTPVCMATLRECGTAVTTLHL